MISQRLLVSVRGKNDTIEAAKGGADIIDAEYPGSALGTCWPANIYTIRQYTPLDRLVSTNIGEKQFVWSTAGQAAVGVAYAGADIIKVGLAELNEQKAKSNLWGLPLVVPEEHGKNYVLSNILKNALRTAWEALKSPACTWARSSAGFFRRVSIRLSCSFWQR